MARINVPEARGVQPQMVGTANLGAQVSAMGRQMQSQVMDAVQKEKQQQWAIDTADIQKKIISAKSEIESQVRYEPTEGKYYLGEQKLDGDLTDFAMQKYDELTADLKSKYGAVGEEWAANKSVSVFGAMTQLQGTTKVIGNINFADDYYTQVADAVSSGTISELEGKSSVEMFTNNFDFGDPKTRARMQVAAGDTVATAAFEKDLRTNTSVAIERLLNDGYGASDVAVNDMNTDMSNHLENLYTDEMQYLISQGEMGYDYKADPNLAGWMASFGKGDKAESLIRAQAEAAANNAMRTDSLQGQIDRANSMLSQAQLSNDAEGVRFWSRRAAYGEAVKERYKKDRRAALREETNKEYDETVWNGSPEDITASINTMRNMNLDVENRQGIENQAFFADEAAVVREQLLGMDSNRRVVQLMTIGSNLNENEARWATKELGVDGNLGVILDLSLGGGANNPERVKTAMFIASPSERALDAIGSKYKSDMPHVLRGVPIDSGAETALTKAIVDGYSAWMTANNKVDYSSSDFREFAKKVTGPIAEVNGKKAFTFTNTRGEFADDLDQLFVDMVDSGMVVAYNKDGSLMSKEGIKKDGYIRGTDVNGEYLVERNGGVSEYYKQRLPNGDLVPLRINLRDFEAQMYAKTKIPHEPLDILGSLKGTTSSVTEFRTDVASGKPLDYVGDVYESAIEGAGNFMEVVSDSFKVTKREPKKIGD